jgi:hypothetical protein
MLTKDKPDAAAYAKFPQQGPMGGEGGAMVVDEEGGALEEKHATKVAQLDQEGVVIRVWGSINQVSGSEASEAGLNEPSQPPLTCTCSLARLRPRSR